MTVQNVAYALEAKRAKDEAIDKAWSDFRAARKRLDGASGKSANGPEKAYGEAYQLLVRLGAAPQIKAKYR